MNGFDLETFVVFVWNICISIYRSYQSIKNTDKECERNAKVNLRAYN